MADENPIETLRPGQILADSAVTDYIKAMGLAIADAQAQLDLNSLAQVGEYVMPRPGLGGKSLLDLGLSPPFYHYQHADLSVSMQIVMKVGEQSAFGINAKLDFGLESGGKVSTANAREAQITLKSLPASVTLNGTKTDATGTEVEAAAEQFANALRSPAGLFERAFTSTERKPVTAALDPGSTKNPILTPNAVAFIAPAESSAGVIRIVDPPSAAETFKLKAGKETSVGPEANRTLYARKVRDAINGLGGYKARLINDPGGTSNGPDAPGALGIALFDTDKAILKPAALAELSLVARMIREGNLTVNVSGYADTRNTDDYNQKLGKRRADAVAQYLRDNGVDGAKIASVTSGGEARWAGAPIPADNAQYRRVEVTIAGSTDLLILVESDGEQLQTTPTPDKTGGGDGNGFIFAKKFSALAVDGTAVKLGAAATSVAIKGDAVATTGANHAVGTPEAFAFNLTRDINTGTATHKVRASQQGGVVVLANADDAVIIDLVTLSASDITLTADGGASMTKPLAGIAAGGGTTPTATKEKPKVALAVGVAVDYRTSRQFEQSVNGNSAISARLVAVPAPVAFLEEIRKYLAPADTPAPTPAPTPTPAP